MALEFTVDKVRTVHKKLNGAKKWYTHYIYLVCNCLTTAFTHPVCTVKYIRYGTSNTAKCIHIQLQLNMTTGTTSGHGRYLLTCVCKTLANTVKWNDNAKEYIKSTNNYSLTTLTTYGTTNLNYCTFINQFRLIR